MQPNNINNLPIAVTVPYNSGVLVVGLLTYSFSIDLGQLINGQLQDPINMKVLSTLTNGKTAYLVYGVDYIATPNVGYPSGGITVTLLRFIENGDTLYFTRYTAANYNTDFTTLINQSHNYANRQNIVFNDVYDILQEEQLATQDLQEAVVNLIPWSAVGVPFGVAPLNSLGVVPLQNLPFSLFTPLGSWNGSTNIPFLKKDIGTPGDAYYINVGGTQTAPSGSPVTYIATNWIVYLESGIWEQFTFPFAVILTQTVTAGDTTHAPSGNAVVNYVSPIALDLQTQINAKADKLGLTPFNVPNLGNLTFNLTVNADGQVTSIAAIPISIDSTNVTDFTTAVGNLIVGKADKIIPAVPGNFASLSSTGNLQDGGASLSLNSNFTGANNTTFPSTLAVANFVNAGLNTKVDTSSLGAANGVATLDAGGKIPTSQLPATASNYLGGWNATINLPFVTETVGSNGDWYSVTAAGTQTAPSGSPVFYEVGSSIIYNGSIWVYNPPSVGVVSVNGLTGAVILTTTNLSEGTNLYYTNARVQAYIITAAASATTAQYGTVQLMAGATTKLVPDQTLYNTRAPLASPGLTGTPTAPTASAATNNTQIATTAFVQTAASSKQNLIASPTNNNIATMNGTGQTINSGKLFSDTPNLTSPSTTRIITELGLVNTFVPKTYKPSIPNYNNYQVIGTYTTAINASGNLAPASTITFGSYVALQITAAGSFSVYWGLDNNNTTALGECARDTRLLNLTGNQIIVSPFPVTNFRVAGASSVQYRTISNYNGAAPVITNGAITSTASLTNLNAGFQSGRSALIVQANGSRIQLFQGVDATTANAALSPMPDISENSFSRIGDFIGFGSMPTGKISITVSTYAGTPIKFAFFNAFNYL